MFTSNTDLTTVLSSTEMSQVITPNANNRKRAEEFAVQEAVAYLNFQYDTDTIFDFSVFDFSISESYTENQIIVDANGVAYTCIQNAPVNTALSNAAFFEQRDDRNPIIVMIIVDLLAYHLFSKAPTNRIPQTVKDRYKEAIEKLKSIRNKKMNPFLPLKENDDPQTTDINQGASDITILSNPKRHNFYD